MPSSVSWSAIIFTFHMVRTFANYAQCEKIPTMLQKYACIIRTCPFSTLSTYIKSYSPLATHIHTYQHYGGISLPHTYTHTNTMAGSPCHTHTHTPTLYCTTHSLHPDGGNSHCPIGTGERRQPPPPCCDTHRIPGALWCQYLCLHVPAFSARDDHPNEDKEKHLGTDGS